MSKETKLSELSIDELLGELRARQRHAVSNLSNEKFRSALDLEEVDSNVLVTVLKSKQKAIYGTDDRIDLFLVDDPALLTSANGVVALFKVANIMDNGNGTSSLQTQNFGTEYNLCNSEPFRDQPTGCDCSGFLVAPDIIATAGHCINNSNINNIRFVFGFRMTNATNATTIVNNSEIYSGIRIIGRQKTDAADWALVQLDRSITNHAILQIRHDGRIGNSQGLYVIGHPCGLPTKFAGGANVRDNTPFAYFVANLDTYGGNSGSPVFNSDTHIVEGILVRGGNGLHK